MRILESTRKGNNAGMTVVPHSSKPERTACEAVSGNNSSANMARTRHRIYTKRRFKLNHPLEYMQEEEKMCFDCIE